MAKSQNLPYLLKLSYPLPNFPATQKPVVHISDFTVQKADGTSFNA
jgi:hypothetical protein